MTKVRVKDVEWSDLLEWLQRNIGPSCMVHARINAVGSGWRITSGIFEDPYAQIPLELYYEVDIEDERLMTLFKLTWL